MRVAQLVVLASLVVLLSSLAAPLYAEDKAKDLIVGKWEPVQPEKGVTAVIEFTKDGKISIAGTAQGKAFKNEGTYKFVDNDTFETTFEFNGQKQTSKTRIVKISKDELVTKDEPKKGAEKAAVKEEKFKRAK
jgi:uncharacterized protein (TIGR03066 family)